MADAEGLGSGEVPAGASGLESAEATAGAPDIESAEVSDGASTSTGTAGQDTPGVALQTDSTSETLSGNGSFVGPLSFRDLSGSSLVRALRGARARSCPGLLQGGPTRERSSIVVLERLLTWPMQLVREGPPLPSLRAQLSGCGSVIIVAEGGNGRLATAFNIVNCMVGSCILLVPGTFRLCGWSTLAVFASMAALESVTSVLIARCISRAEELVPEEERKGEPVDWPLIGQAALGRSGRLLVKGIWLAAIHLQTVNGLVLNGTNLKILFQEASDALLIGASGVAVFATLFVPTAFLEYFSFTGIVVTVLMVAALLTSGLALPELPLATEYQVFVPGPLTAVVPTALLCCFMHGATPTIYLAADTKTRPCFGKVSIVAFGCAFLLYGSFGTVGYYFFADSTQANVAANIALDLHMDRIPRLGFLRLVLAALTVAKQQVLFPLYCWMFLDSVSSALPLRWRLARGSGLLLKVLFLLFTTVPAIFLARDIDAMASLTGAIAATSLAVLFPVAFYAMLFRDQLRGWHVALLGILFAGGVCLQTVGAWKSIERILRGA